LFKDEKNENEKLCDFSKVTLLGKKKKVEPRLTFRSSGSQVQQSSSTGEILINAMEKI
jgi:hypothetical protein